MRGIHTALENRKDTRPFPLVDVCGPPFQRGFQFGRACGDMISRYPDILQRVLSRDAKMRDPRASPRELTRKELEERALRFLNFFEQFAPRQIEEIKGIAAGAEVPFSTALLVNVRGEVGVFDGQPEAPSGCTAFAAGATATANSGVLIAQNQDQGWIASDLVVILRVEPDHGPRMLFATFGGLLGYGGINSAGVGMMQNQLANSSWRFGLPHYPLKRAFLEQENISGCLDVLKRAQLGSCANYVLVDKKDVMDIEVTPDGFAVIEGTDGCTVHSNNFRDSELAKDDCLIATLPDSPARCERMDQLLVSRRGQITFDDAKSWLSDHEGYPSSVCRHTASDDPTALATMYAVICEVDKGVMHVAAGNPCSNSFHTYSLD